MLIIKLDINLGVIVMNPFGGIVQKAFYLGLGLATVERNLQ